MQSAYVSIDRVLDFVDRTTSRGAPLRVAAKRAERRFHIDRKVILLFATSRVREPVS